MSETRTVADAHFAADHAAWHDQVEARRAGPYGPLSVASIDWLTAEPQRFPEVPGIWSAAADGMVLLTAAPADGITREGVPVDGTVRIGPLTGIESSTLEAGELRIEVAARGGSIALRTRRPDAPDRLGYEGTATFPADPRWVIDARFEAEPTSDVEVETYVPGSRQHYDSPGIAAFEIDGTVQRLVLFHGNGPDGLRAIFADASGADLSFPSARNVEVTRTGPDSVRIDFNRATNPPCAYSAHATCPFPPPGNRLAVRIEAGELRPGVAAR